MASPVPTPVPTPTPTPLPVTAAMPSTVSTPNPSWTAPPAENVPTVADDSSSAIVQQLIASERAVRDESVNGDALLWNGHLQQLVYRKLVDHPELRGQVLGLVPEDLRTAAVANLNAGVELRSMISRPRDSLPAWRIVEPASIDALLAHYRAAEAEFGVHWSYLASIHLIETRMGRIRGTSSAGAQGPMQFIPSTWAAYGEGDVNSDADAIRAAARYLRASGAPTDMDRALYAYNHSWKYVRAVKAYADVMRGDPAAYRGYHQWQVYYLTVRGDVLLPVGYVKE